MNWYKSESTAEPKKLEYVGDLVYLRRNITSEVRNGVTYYSYEEAHLTEKEYNDQLNSMETLSFSHSMQQFSDADIQRQESDITLIDKMDALGQELSEVELEIAEG